MRLTDAEAVDLFPKLPRRIKLWNRFIVWLSLKARRGDNGV